MSIIELKVKEKGRTVLPVALQETCGFGPGDILIVEQVSEGRFVVETKESKINRLWHAASSTDSEVNTEGLLQDRVKQDKARVERIANPQPTSQKESRKKAKALLAAVMGD
jgi:bifunctional DNA-binding transcriptional regulator/antitoxin component of YhaV-PrlF toxin-antitoxin module